MSAASLKLGSALVVSFLMSGAIPIRADTVTSSAHQVFPTSSVKQEQGKLLLVVYLNMIGLKLDRYFTIESDINSNDPQSYMTYRELKNEDVKTVQSLLTKLSNDLPDADVLQDATNPKIIHLVAKSLSHDPSYPINHNVDIDFSGVLGDLPDAIGYKTHTNIGTPLIIFNGSNSDDRVTRVVISVKNRAVRSVLTDYVPLSAYSHILWAATSNKNRKQQTVVMYGGPVRRNLSPQNHE